MQHMLAESYYLNFPREAVIFVIQSGCKSAVWLGKITKTRAAENPNNTTSGEVTLAMHN